MVAMHGHPDLLAYNRTVPTSGDHSGIAVWEHDECDILLCVGCLHNDSSRSRLGRHVITSVGTSSDRYSCHRGIT